MAVVVLAAVASVRSVSWEKKLKRLHGTYRSHPIVCLSPADVTARRSAEVPSVATTFKLL